MDEPLREKIRAEIMGASWADLVYQFARGGLVLVRAELDLLDVATAVAADDRTLVQGWLASGALWRATEHDALRFQQSPALRFQFVIVQPWVLAQPL